VRCGDDQYKEKSAREREGGSVRLSLLTYPVLMAADILAYGTDEVRSGRPDAARELARDLRCVQPAYGIRSCASALVRGGGAG